MNMPAAGGARRAGEAGTLAMSDYNHLLVKKIHERVCHDLAEALQCGERHVVRAGADGVLSVAGAGRDDDTQDIVFGPAPFAACIGYVNARLPGRVAEAASGDGRFPGFSRHGKPEEGTRK